MTDDGLTEGTATAASGQVEGGLESQAATPLAPSDVGGQPAAAPASQATGAQPQGGDSTPGSQAEGSGQAEAEDTFFDASKVIGTPIEPAYREMQRAFTEKTTAIADVRKAADAYNNLMSQFNSNPTETLRLIANQAGVDLSQMGAPAGEASLVSADDPYVTELKQQIRAELITEFQPILSQVQKLQTQSIESELSKIDENWRIHEDAMTANLGKHKSLVHDPAALYRLSVPQSVLNARATQAAIDKFQQQGNQPAGVTLKQNPAVVSDEPPQNASFAESVTWAKEQLAKQGISPSS